jgi:WD40 repeat protein
VLSDRHSILFGDGEGNIVFYSFINSHSFVHAPHLKILNLHLQTTSEPDCGDRNDQNIVNNDDHLVGTNFSKSDQLISSSASHFGIIRSIIQINETYFASGGEDSAVKVWRIDHHSKSIKLVHTFQHLNFVQDLIYDHNDHSLFSCSYDGIISIWKIEIDQ